ncbi:S1 family peptidase [Nocardioides immobilis]|uniref:S1 family peptidase n=1 Tax=Nocardioides immobilis TaxID=2049295 RepID=UPI0015FB64F5|nr:serine protease [Nocardioides immobilis]
MKSPIEQLLFATVRITTKVPGGTGRGTGFVFQADIDETHSALVVVTNKHVIEGASEVELHFIRSTPDGQSPLLGQEFVVSCSPTSFFGHSDPDIDVAALGIGGTVDQLKAQGVRLFYRSIPAEYAATPAALENFEPIEPVTFIGYPNGLFDTSSLLPIVRRGHAATALSVDYEGRPVFLIDASVFPGSSGSPVFLYVPASVPDKHGNINLGLGPQLLFLGVVAAVHQRAVPVLQTSAHSIPYVNELLDIGVVYKASTVLETVQGMIDQHQARQAGSN